MDRDSNCASLKGSPAGQINAAKDLWHIVVSMEGEEAHKQREERMDESGHCLRASEDGRHVMTPVVIQTG